MKPIVKMKFGSHLYGTDTPSSDTDFKGVFMPSREQILLGEIPKSLNEKTNKNSNTKNTAEDVDIEIYSLHYFLKLACDGETVALDMLHAPMNMCEEWSSVWQIIVNNRQRFYTKNLKAFIGYARRQAAKYGIKGSRLNDAERVLFFLHGVLPCGSRLGLYWDQLPEGEFIHKHPPNENGEMMYEVCGRKLGEKVSISYAYDVVKRFVDSYGERARQAANNEGIDWKAVSHAFRAAFQVKQILTEGTITFPLKQAGFLRDIKIGHFHFANELSPILDNLMTEIDELAAASGLPEQPDRKFWRQFLFDTVDQSLKGARI